MAAVRVKLYKNMPNQTEPKLYLVETADFNNFLKQAGKRLGIDAKYAYTASGATLDDVAVLREDEVIYLSESAGFYRSEAHAPRYKIAILGPGGVGKSCLTIRYTRNTFVETYDPTIEDAFRHQTVVDDRVVVMEILDTAGQEEFKCLSPSWVEGKDGFLLVFSLCDDKSLTNCASYFRMIQKEAEQKGKTLPSLVLVGNKADMPDKRRITSGQAQETANEWTAGYVETSARTGYNVDKAFEDLVRQIRRRTDAVPNRTTRRSLCNLL